MCPAAPLSSDPVWGFTHRPRGARAHWGPAHTPPSLEEIEKKLNIYHKGAKIWKMLIFCQVGLSPFLLGGRGSGQNVQPSHTGERPRVCVMRPRGDALCGTPRGQPRL